MNQDLEPTQSQEQQIIDRLVEAVERGDAAAKAGLGWQLLDGQVGHGWHACLIVEAEHFAPLEEFDAWSGSEFSEFLSHDLGVESGPRHVMPASPFAELKQWWDITAGWCLTDESKVVWAVLRVRHTDRRGIYIAVTGTGGYELLDVCHAAHYLGWDYSTFLLVAGRDGFSGWEYVAATSDYTDAVAALKRVGFIGPSDFARRRDELLPHMQAESFGSREWAILARHDEQGKITRRLEMKSADLIEGLRLLAAAERRGALLKLSFNGQTLQLVRGLSRVEVPAAGTWESIALTSVGAITGLLRRRRSLPEELVLVGTEAHLHFSHFTVPCAWALPTVG